MASQIWTNILAQEEPRNTAKRARNIAIQNPKKSIVFMIRGNCTSFNDAISISLSTLRQIWISYPSTQLVLQKVEEQKCQKLLNLVVRMTTCIKTFYSGNCNFETVSQLLIMRLRINLGDFNEHKIVILYFIFVKIYFWKFAIFRIWYRIFSDIRIIREDFKVSDKGSFVPMKLILDS